MSTPKMSPSRDAANSPFDEQYDESSSRTTISSNGAKERSLKEFIPPRLDMEMKELFAENVAAKIWRVAQQLSKDQVTAVFGILRGFEFTNKMP